MKHLFPRPFVSPQYWLALALAGPLARPTLAQTPPATFAAAATFSTGANSNGSPQDVAVADVNGDGKPDLITTFFYNLVGVLLGTGTGAFGAITKFSTGADSHPSTVIVADVNGDDKPDLLLANRGSNTIGLMLGTGTGTFGAVTSLPAGTGSEPEDVAIADVNGDGKLDLLTANYGSNTVGVLLGLGAGTFRVATTFSTGAGSQPVAVRVADVNGDGNLDLLTANLGDGKVGVLLGTGTGTFGAATAISTGTSNPLYNLAVADVNGDGKPDLLAPNYKGSTVGVLLGTGSGTFGAATAISTGAGSMPFDVAVADVNRDGKPDLLTANQGSGAVGVLLGTGSGAFGAATALNGGLGSLPQAIKVADVNGDGKLDVLTANAGYYSLGVRLNTTVLATRAVLPGASASLAPNPATATTTLAATGLPVEARRLDATLYNALGQVVRRLALPIAAGAAQAALPTASLPAGAYLLRLTALDTRGTALGTLPTQRLTVE